MTPVTETKTFPLRVLLTVTTGRLLTEGKDLYEILGWMTGESPFIHQRGRFIEECKPWLLQWFPELVCVSIPALEKWVEADKTGTNQEGIKMWLTEQKMVVPGLKDEYEVGKIHVGDHKQKDPIAELEEMGVGKDKIVTVAIEPEDPADDWKKG